MRIFSPQSLFYFLLGFSLANEQPTWPVRMKSSPPIKAGVSWKVCCPFHAPIISHDHGPTNTSLFSVRHYSLPHIPSSEIGSSVRVSLRIEGQACTKLQFAFFSLCSFATKAARAANSAARAIDSDLALRT